MQQKRIISNLRQSYAIAKQHNKNGQIKLIQNNLQTVSKKQKVAAGQKGQKQAKVLKKDQDISKSYKLRRNLRIIGILLSILQFSNIIALNFIEYNSEQIILQLFIAFIILPIFSVSFYVVFVCLLLSAIRKHYKFFIQQQNVDHEPINSQFKTKPILFENRCDSNQKKTAKASKLINKKPPSKDVLTIKKMHDGKNQSINKEKTNHSTLAALKISTTICKLFNIVINIIFATLSLVIYITHTSSNGFIQAQIVFAYFISIINLSLTYNCYMSEEIRVNKVIDNQNQGQSVNILRSHDKKTSLDHQISIKFNNNQQQINEQNYLRQDKPKMLCFSLEQSPSHQKNIMKQSLQRPYSQIESQSSPVDPSNKQDLKKSVLKISGKDLMNKTKSIDLQKKKVEINFQNNQIFEYSDIYPSNQNSIAEKDKPQSIQQKIKKAKHAKKSRMLMQIQLQLLKKKRIQREIFLNSMKLKSKSKELTITDKFTQNSQINKHI